ncbi:MAG: zinc ribbon domain-containing protein [Candidatus Margulisbacteria bacterium]|nr:zinc ribbon domain-containing protein [Candidatus Margulisiibacteriota bacterium]
MPLYDYKCTKCGHIFEVMQRISEEPLKFCPQCKGEIKRLISAAGIVFKGSGFYATDSKKSQKASVPAPKSEKKESKESKSKEVSK